jgi:hypothetical protein
VDDERRYYISHHHNFAFVSVVQIEERKRVGPRYFVINLLTIIRKKINPITKKIKQIKNKK